VIVLLTLVGSGVGALVLLSVPVHALQIIIAIAMIAVAAFTIQNRNLGVATHVHSPSRAAVLGAYVSTFLLAIYGGFFSGGYVTMLSTVFVVLLGTTFLQAVATTKIINVFSSAVATLVFVGHGIVDPKLGAVLGVSMFSGALLGGRVALLLSSNWLRRIFLVAVCGLAIKMIWQ
jgi:hypothetical protein